MKKSNKHSKNSSRQTSNPRLVAHQLLTESVKGGIVTDNLGNRLAETSLSDLDRRLAYEIVVNCNRRRQTLDYLITWYGNRDIESVDVAVRIVLWIGFYQMRYMDKIPPHAAVSESVEIAKTVAGKGASGFVNALLRKYLRQPELIDERLAQMSPLEKLAFNESHPLWLLERWHERLSLDQLHNLCVFNNNKPPLVLRVHTVNITVDDFLNNLSQREIEFERSPVHSSCVRLVGLHNVEQLPGYNDGWFAVQDETTLRIIDRLDVRPGNKVLDVCTAPGGKMAYLSLLTGSSGQVIAVDSNKRRMKQVSETIERLRLSNITTVVADGTTMDEIEPASFDHVVVDAPCSNTGVFRKRPEARWRLFADDFTRLADLQGRLLANAARFVAKGGKLLYSTCSIDHEENEMVAQRFVESNPSFTLLDMTTYIPESLSDPDGGFCALFSCTNLI